MPAELMSQAGEILQCQWKWDMVVLSFLVSLSGANAAVSMNDIRRQSLNVTRRRTLLAVTSFQIGGVSIWMMHFVGMGAMSLTLPSTGDDVPISYDLILTTLSFVIGTMSVSLGLMFASHDPYWYEIMQDRRLALMIEQTKDMRMEDAAVVWKVQTEVLFKNLGRITGCGFFIGSGAAAMHYLGILGQNFNAVMTINIYYLLLSIAIAIVAAIVACWLIFRLLTFRPRLSVRLTSSVIIAIAVVGMHYCGMAAVSYEYAPDIPYDSSAGGAFSSSLPRITSYLGFILSGISEVWVHSELQAAVDRLQKAPQTEASKPPHAAKPGKLAQKASSAVRAQPL